MQLFSIKLLSFIYYFIKMLAAIESDESDFDIMDVTSCVAIFDE